MRNFNNTINYFFQKFYSNLKYSNRILHSLRIFFERTTKNINVVSWLGNVYRNSKWSSLNIQNIKPSFRYQATSIFFFYLLSVLILYTFKHNLSILQFFVFTPSYFWYITQDWLSYSSLLILSLFYFIIQKVDLIFSSLIPNFFLNVKSSSLTKQTNDNILINKLKDHKFYAKKDAVSSLESNDNSLSRQAFLEITFYLQKTVNTLNLLNYEYSHLNEKYLSNTIDFQKVTSNSKDYSTKLFFLTSNNFNIKPYNNLTLSKEECKFRFYRNKTKLIHTNVLDLSTLLKSNFILQKLVTANLSKNLNLAKQNRWLWKNSIISDKGIIQLNKITHLKKLVSNPELNPTLTKFNIWGSNKLSSNTMFDASSTTELYNKNNLHVSQFFNYFSSPSNLDKYEDSIMWLIKRFSFTQKMNYNNQYLITKDNYLLKKELESKNDVSVLLFNKFYYNYNLLNLNVSFYKVTNTSTTQTTTTQNIRNLTSNMATASQELLTNSDNLFVKSLVTNISFRKNSITFYSYF